MSFPETDQLILLELFLESEVGENGDSGKKVGRFGKSL